MYLLQLTKMEKHNPGRLALIVASLVSYIIIIVFNILAGPGLGELA